MKVKHHKKKRLTHKQKRIRNIAVILTIALLVLLAYQAISGIINGDWTRGSNFYGQPVDPALQLLGLTALVIVSAVLAWRYFFGREKTKEEMKKEKKAERKHSHLKYPLKKMPWE